MNTDFGYGKIHLAVNKGKIEAFARGDKPYGRGLVVTLYATLNVVKGNGVLNYLGVFAS